MRVILALLLSLVATVASADITIRNFNGFSTDKFGTVQKYDDVNNAVDAHDGMVIQDGGTFYLIGTSYGCGFDWQVTGTPWCGFNIYSSADLGYNKKWHLEGKLFDPNSGSWQTRCNGSSNGCFELRVIFNPGNSTYVFWFNQLFGTAQSEWVFTCTTVKCGATPSVAGTPTHQPQPTALVHGAVFSSQALFVDDDGSCYLLYNHDDGLGGHPNYIDKLNSTCTDSIGTSVTTGLDGEGDALFKNGSTYYAVTGSLCGYCDTGATTIFATASSALGTWSASTQISALSCAGQLQSINKIVSGGITSFLYAADQWTGSHAEGGAALYWQPLTFTGSAIDNLTCANTATVQGITPDPNPTVLPPSNADQSSGAIGFHDTCDVGASSVARMQTFVPTQAALATIYVPIAKNIANGTLTVALVNVDGSNNPTSTISSATYNASDLNSAGTWTAIPVHGVLTPSSTYGIVLTSTASAGCYSVPVFYGTFPNPYATGVERYWNGSIWTTETDRALMFATVPPIAGAGRFPFRR